MASCVAGIGRVLGVIFRWVFVGILTVLLASMLVTGNWLQGAVLTVAAVVLLLPASAPSTGPLRYFPWWGRWSTVLALFAVFVWVGTLTQYTSAIYKSPEVKAQFLRMYAEQMQMWPVPHRDLFIHTEYGRVHVIESGPEGAPPLVLIPASGVGGWSWRGNVADLSRHFRTYVIDTLGDAGLSELTDRDHYPRDGRAQARLYAELFDRLGLQAVYIAGASEGGFIATNIALYEPQRVRKLVLLGPMGYAGTGESVARIMFTQFFPLPWVVDGTVPWAFGDNPAVVNTFGPWLRLMITGTFPRKARPVRFSEQALRTIRVPVLLVLGAYDNLVGEPPRAEQAAHQIPDLKVYVLPTGHLIAAERPRQVDELTVGFLVRAMR